MKIKSGRIPFWGALALALLTHSYRSYAALQVTQATDQSAAQKLVPSSSGLSVSSISSLGSDLQLGTFTALGSDNIGGGSSSVDLLDGVILSSGNVNHAEGSNTGAEIESLQDNETDSDVSALMSPQASLDVSTLQFTVSNSQGYQATLRLWFTFASEEYSNWDGQSGDLYNDAAGIWVNGSEVASVDVATINSFTNPSYWHDNGDEVADNSRFFSANFKYDGYTISGYADVLVPSGQSKAVKIAVGDGAGPQGTDTWLDSAIFVQSEVIWGTTPSVSVSTIDSTAMEWPVGGPADKGKFRITRTGSTASALTVYYTTGGTAIGPSPTMDYEIYLAGTSTPKYTSAVIPAGYSYVDLEVWPWHDGYADTPETVTITLSLNSSYSVSSPVGSVIISELPHISISVLDDSAFEVNPDTGMFRITRSGPTSSALTVYYTTGGTAIGPSPTMDYEIYLAGTWTPKHTSAVIPSWSSYVDLEVRPWWDGYGENSETVILDLSEDVSYFRQWPVSGVVTVYEQ